MKKIFGHFYSGPPSSSQFQLILVLNIGKKLIAVNGFLARCFYVLIKMIVKFFVIFSIVLYFGDVFSSRTLSFLSRHFFIHFFILIFNGTGFKNCLKQRTDRF